MICSGKKKTKNGSTWRQGARKVPRHARITRQRGCGRDTSGVQKTQSQGVIFSSLGAFVCVCAQYHPDKCEDTDAKEKFQEVAKVRRLPIECLRLAPGVPSFDGY